MEHFIETDWSGYFVGSNGTIINNTGIKSVQYVQDKTVYVGLEFEKNKRIMKRLPYLVYQYHINKGRPLVSGLSIKFKDNNPTNCRVENLQVVTTFKFDHYENGYFLNVNRKQSNKGSFK